MPLHSLLVINSSGNILFSKYFIANQENLTFENALYVNTRHVWNKKACSNKQTFSTNSIRVVFQKLGELIIFVSGIEEVDETICKFFYRPKSTMICENFLILIYSE
jgi:hypothetical protein